MRLLRAGTRNYGGDDRVDLTDPLSIRYFTRAFGCTEAQLLEAIAVLGLEKANLRCRFRPRAMTRRRASRQHLVAPGHMALRGTTPE